MNEPIPHQNKRDYKTAGNETIYESLNDLMGNTCTNKMQIFFFGNPQLKNFRVEHA